MIGMTKLGVRDAIASFLVMCKFEIDHLSEKQYRFPIIKIHALAKQRFYKCH